MTSHCITSSNKYRCFRPVKVNSNGPRTNFGKLRGASTRKDLNTEIYFWKYKTIICHCKNVKISTTSASTSTKRQLLFLNARQKRNTAPGLSYSGVGKSSATNRDIPGSIFVSDIILIFSLAGQELLASWAKVKEASPHGQTDFQWQVPVTQCPGYVASPWMFERCSLAGCVPLLHNAGWGLLSKGSRKQSVE